MRNMEQNEERINNVGYGEQLEETEYWEKGKYDKTSGIGEK